MSTELIDKLGGTGAVANALGKPSNVISNWKARGIPWRFRPALARLATERGIPVPRDFLDPTNEAA